MGAPKRLLPPVAVALVLALPTLLVIACSDTGDVPEVDEASIQAALEAYLPRLAEAYSIGDLEALKAFAEENGIGDEHVRGILERHAGPEELPLRERLAGVLEGYAAEKEIAGMEKRVDDLLLESRVIRPTVKSVEVEDVQIWNYANAFVTTREVWDLRVYAAGTDTLLSEAPDQHNRVKYQLKREGTDGWLVLFRELDTTFE